MQRNSALRLPRHELLEATMVLSQSEWLCEKEVARIFKISIRKLQKDRQARVGFPFVKLERTVRYYRPEIIKYLEKHSIHNLPMK